MDFVEGEVLREQVTSGKATPAGLQVENSIDVKVEHPLL
jgi:hypothetical protein